MFIVPATKKSSTYTKVKKTKKLQSASTGKRRVTLSTHLQDVKASDFMQELSARHTQSERVPSTFAATLAQSTLASYPQHTVQPAAPQLWPVTVTETSYENGYI